MQSSSMGLKGDPRHIPCNMVPIEVSAERVLRTAASMQQIVSVYGYKMGLNNDILKMNYLGLQIYMPMLCNTAHTYYIVWSRLAMLLLF